jgi:ferredoxin
METPRYAIVVEGAEDRGFTCGADEGVLAAMERAGGEPVPVGCRRGGCGHCRVLVLEGDYELGKMSAAEVSPDERAEGYALACRLFPRSELRIRPCRRRR